MHRGMLAQLAYLSCTASNAFRITLNINNPTCLTVDTTRIAFLCTIKYLRHLVSRNRKRA